jgi:tetratricopeptide (TPR) repeat protein
MMKRGWMKCAILLFVMLFACSCATTSKEEKKEEVKVKEEKVKEDKVKKEEVKEVKAKEEKAEDFYLKGIQEFKEGDFEDSIVQFKKAIEKNKRYFNAYYALGQSYEKLNKDMDAEEAYLEAVRIEPGNLSAREALGLTRFHQKKFAASEDQLKEARTLGSKLPEIYYCLGEIEQREHFCKTAIIAYKQALALDPDYMPARNGLKAAEAACKQKKPTQKRPYIRR